MLRFKSGHRPAIRRPLLTLSSALLSALALLLVLPSLASAASTTLTLSDTIGAGVDVTIHADDGVDPGNIVITLSLESTGAAASLQSLHWFTNDDDLYPGVSSSGDDVQFNLFHAENNGTASPCRCNLIAGFEEDYLGTASGLQETTFVISHSTLALSLANLSETQVRVALIIDAPNAGTNGEPWNKVRGHFSDLTVIPEPSTAILMLLGLGGLSAVSRRENG